MMTQGLKKATLTAMIATFGLAGCVENTGRTSQQDAGIAVGGLLGAVAGGLAGTQVGKGRGRTTAIIAGSILGGLAGGAIGNRLGQRDEQLAQQATQQTLASAPVNQPVRWQNPQSGVYGDVVATTPVYQQPYYAPNPSIAAITSRRFLSITNGMRRQPAQPVANPMGHGASSPNRANYHGLKAELRLRLFYCQFTDCRAEQHTA